MTSLYPNILDIYLAPFFFIFGFILIYKIKLLTNLSSTELVTIYFYHSLLCIIYYYFSINNFNDSVYYFRNVLHIDHQNYNFKFGTPFIQSFIKLLVLNLNISLLPLFLIFNIIGSLGLILIFNAFKKIIHHGLYEKFIILFLCFLPSIYFWSSSVGKEPFTYLATGLLLNSFNNKKINYLFIILAFFLLLSVRPFMAGFLVIAVSLGLVLKPNKYLKFTIVFIISFLIFFINFVINYLKNLNINIFYDFNGFISFISKRKSDTYANQFTDMTNESFFYHFFSYIFRPLPFERFDFLTILNGIENLILIFITITCIKKFNLRSIFNNNHHILLIYSLLTCFFLVIATYNLGIAIRQKWYFLLPFFFILLHRKQIK